MYKHFLAQNLRWCKGTPPVSAPGSLKYVEQSHKCKVWKSKNR